MHPVCAHECHCYEITGLLQRTQYKWHERFLIIKKTCGFTLQKPQQNVYDKQILGFN